MTELNKIALQILSKGKGILAADESTATMTKRLNSVKVQSNENNRLLFRQTLFSSLSMKECIGGVILYDETIRQKTSTGKTIPELINSTGSLTGIKVDTGAKELAGSKEEKITLLKSIAKETVDIKGVGFYSLGLSRKNLNDSQKTQYLKLFENYFLKSFSSRLAEYTNPEIEVNNKKVLSKNYTIVNSLLVGTSERPEVKIDWRVYTKDPKNPLIRDLIIEGLSLARTQKEEFSSILNSNDGDINALFKTLEEFSQN